MKDFKQLQKAAEDAKSEFTAFERKDVQFRENLKHAKAKVRSPHAEASGAQRMHV